MIKEIWVGWRGIIVMVFNATFNNISIFLVEETGVPGEYAILTLKYNFWRNKVYHSPQNEN
jgi:hypothetical protein